MPLTDRVLMGPGPSNPYPEAVEALGRPMLGHLDPEFLGVLDETCERLRQVFGTANDRTLPLSGTGSAGMEAAFVNLVGPGDVVVVGVNGVFGERMCDVAGRCGADVVRVEAPWGRAIDPSDLLGAHPSPKVIAVVHAETSTGVRNDIEPLGAIGDRPGEAVLLVDCVTSLGGIPVEIDGWAVDVAYSGTQKCLGVAPGLSPFTMSDWAWSRRVEKPQSWYLDLGMIGDYATTKGARKYHHTAPISMILSLHAALGAILDEGLDAVWRRHAGCGRELQEGLQKLGFELFAEEGHRLPELTTVWVPESIRADEAAVRATLLDRHGIEVGGGLGEFAGKVWRIGCMGHTARPRNVTLLLGALAEVLG
ncbi:MAG TPA: alanine--glyoxylate aminotransferase family protein [Acidimicrobiales bacterium]|nr:alanine--glyoxylate aminotransferase family protein [Acidimicrobiales bacterium]